MSTKTKIKWRLSTLPTPEEVTLLLAQDVLTKDEAREILFSLETEEERNKKSLQDEIKFLRELVAKLSTNRSVIIETIREVHKPYKQYDWYQPYNLYASTAAQSSLSASSTNAVYSLNASASGAGGSGVLQLNSSAPSLQDFTDIKTF